MNLLEAVLQHIHQSGIASFGLDMFANSYPARAPDECLLVIDNGGTRDAYWERSDRAIQVVSRSSIYPAAYDKIQRVCDLFHGETARANYQLGQYYVYTSRMAQEPGYIGDDEKGRPEISVNLVFTVRSG